MVINSNLSAQSAAAQLKSSADELAHSLQRLSSGSKLASPADDSAGLAVSMKLGAQVARIGAAQNNVSNAISFTQTQDGYLQQLSTAISRMSELTIQAQDVTKSASDRLNLDQELHALSLFVHDAAGKTFNGVSLFSGQSLNVATDEAGSTFTLTGVNLSSPAYLNLLNDRVNIIGNNGTGAIYAMNDVHQILVQIATDRASLGSNLEALNYYSGILAAAKTNLSAANSQITDVDVAQESTRYARQNILVQSGTAMLAQANVLPQSVLKLLG